MMFDLLFNKFFVFGITSLQHIFKRMEVILSMVVEADETYHKVWSYMRNTTGANVEQGSCTLP